MLRGRDAPVDREALPGGAGPRELLGPREPRLRQLRAPARVHREPAQRVAERSGVNRIDVLDGVGTDLGDRRGASGHDGRAAGHRLDDRQAEALVHRGIHEHLGGAVERGQIAERDVAGEGDRVGDVRSRDQILDAARQPAIGADADEPVLEAEAGPRACEGFDERRQVLARLDRPDVEDGVRRQVVRPLHPIDLRAIGDAAELRRRGFVDDVHASGIERVELHDLALGALRHGDQRVGAAHRQVHQRTIQHDAARRMEPRQQAQAHVVDRHDRGHARHQRHHAVGEVRDVGADLAKHAGHARLHPHHAWDAPGVVHHLHARRQRRGCLDRTVGDDDQLVIGGRGLREMAQQVLRVVPDAGPVRPERRPVKRDAHPPASSRRRPRPRRNPGSTRTGCRSARS
jgi:hypothetical protein